MSVSAHLPGPVLLLGICCGGLLAKAPCDSLVPEYCALPYPNSYFTVPSLETATGVRLNFSVDVFPPNTLDVPLNPHKWNTFGKYTTTMWKP